TNFVTDEQFQDYLLFQAEPCRLDEVGLFTDGIQRLALNFATKTAHQPFFLPMFASLRDSSGRDHLPKRLRGFLDCAEVNSRTDDDKTLVLASRLQAGSRREDAV